MDIRKQLLYVCLMGFLTLLPGLAGCNNSTAANKAELEKPIPLGVTVGSLGRVYQYRAVPVRGFGIVAGLPGTGSSECPPDLRTMLIKYINQQMPRDVKFDAGQFIDSRDTAVVEIYGVIPSLASVGENFDVKIRSLSRTQTISLDGGRLYTADLKEARGFTGLGFHLKTLATAKGPIYIDKLGDQPADMLEGYILGGGTVINAVRTSFALHQPNYYASTAIRNQINERFGSKTATAHSPEEIFITIPKKYQNQKERFISLLGNLFLADNPQQQQERIAMLAVRLAGDKNKRPVELALEAIGRRATDTIVPLLNDPNETTRFHAARCLLNLGDERGLFALKTMTEQESSVYRLEAITAIGMGADRSKASPILLKLLEDNSFPVRWASYEQLWRLEDVSITRLFVAGDFFVDQIRCQGPKAVYISRKDSPRIVVFGSPIPIKDDAFFNSADGQVLINARPEDKEISMVRKDPRFPRPIGPLKASRDIGDVVRTMCERLDVEKKPGLRQGLNLPYCDSAAVLKQMCKAGIIDAEFIPGPITKVGQ
ncbi:MAG: flagellar basal body P-ring protein FlgI [Sedimentisphaerales bacterium]|nr:flagellar basal body P-ring protein FlgI [Sedimentisphaerales bacterium]